MSQINPQDLRRLADVESSLLALSEHKPKDSELLSAIYSALSLLPGGSLRAVATHVATHLNHDAKGLRSRVAKGLA